MKTEELCLSEKENTYVDSLIDYMLDVDRGISILSKTFKDYGAESPYFINGEELVVSKDLRRLTRCFCFRMNLSQTNRTRI